MTEPDCEKFDSLMESFFKDELPAAKLKHGIIARMDTVRVEPVHSASSSTRRLLVLVVTALSLLVTANVFWQPRPDKTSTDGVTDNSDPDRPSPTPVSRPHVSMIPRIQNRQDTVILPEGQAFGMNFSQVDERREHVDSKLGTRFNLTSEQFEIELFPIPEKKTKSSKATKKTQIKTKNTPGSKKIKTPNNPSRHSAII